MTARATTDTTYWSFFSELPLALQRGLATLLRMPFLGYSSKAWAKALLVGSAAGVALYAAFKQPGWIRGSSSPGIVHCARANHGNIMDHSASVISRVMLPDDANPAGNVHGGTILHMIDQAGWATATRFFNQSQASTVGIAGLARIEHVDFLKPMFIGELARITAEVTYTSEHSIEVTVNVYAENALTDTTRLTNKARLWYVVKEVKDHRDLYEHSRRTQITTGASLPVPQLEFDNEEDAEKGAQRYAYQKEQRVTRFEVNKLHPPTPQDATLIHLMLPSDCYANGTAQAGAILKLMDTAAGVLTFKHCHTNAVTASLEAVDFHHPVYNGNLIELHSRAIFTSSRSIDVMVDVYAADAQTMEKRLAAQSIFTFVSLDKRGRPKPIPQLEVTTEAEKARYNIRKERYLQRKEQRRLEKARLLAEMQEKQSSAESNDAADVGSNSSSSQQDAPAQAKGEESKQ